YDTEKDFAPITQVARVPMLLVVHPSLPAKNVKELVALAQSKPNGLNFASGGIGASQHLAGELFKFMTGVQMVHVAYKGAAASVNDVLAGQAQLTFGDMVAFLPHAKAGRVRAIAVTTAQRSPAVPDLPTIAEAGVPGYEVYEWNAVFAPAGTPADAIAKTHSALARALAAPEVKERITALGGEASGLPPAETAKWLQAQVEKWARVVKDANIRLE
ncbi:MAG: tripartite tricarboxylate transporter substrate-binding protein, partial [Proteobacteria bacterium]|nr:tripartite tricarboxylate transporter substrate-binding protein [Pseudomonadota bacterium]